MFAVPVEPCYQILKMLSCPSSRTGDMSPSALYHSLLFTFSPSRCQNLCQICPSLSCLTFSTCWYCIHYLFPLSLCPTRYKCCCIKDSWYFSSRLFPYSAPSAQEMEWLLNLHAEVSLGKMLMLIKIGVGVYVQPARPACQISMCCHGIASRRTGHPVASGVVWQIPMNALPCSLVFSACIQLWI